MVFSEYRAGTAMACESAFDLPPVGRYLSAHGPTVFSAMIYSIDELDRTLVVLF